MSEDKKPTRLHIGEAKIRTWFAEIEEGTPYEALFDPIYWDVHGYKFQPGDFIRVEPDDGAYTADLKVVGVGVGGVRVEEFYKKDWRKIDAPATLLSQYRVKFAGPHHRWRVERIADGHVEQAGFQSETDANVWLAENLKALSAAAAKAEAAKAA
jgi:hypothetical protein